MPSQSESLSLKLTSFEEIAHNQEYLELAATGLSRIIQNDKTADGRIHLEFSNAKYYRSLNLAKSRIQKLANEDNFFVITSGLDIVGLASTERSSLDLESGGKIEGQNVSFWTETAKNRPQHLKRRIGSEIVNLIVPEAIERSKTLAFDPLVWTGIRPQNDASLNSFHGSNFQLKQMGSLVSTGNNLPYNIYEIVENS